MSEAHSNSLCQKEKWMCSEQTIPCRFFLERQFFFCIILAPLDRGKLFHFEKMKHITIWVLLRFCIVRKIVFILYGLFWSKVNFLRINFKNVALQIVLLILYWSCLQLLLIEKISAAVTTTEVCGWWNQFKETRNSVMKILGLMHSEV